MDYYKMIISNHLHLSKLLTLFSIFFLSSLSLVNGQTVDGKTFNSKGYQAWVTLDDSRVTHGLLWRLDADKIEIKSDQVKQWKNPNSNATTLEIPIERITSVRIKRINAVWKGYGYGVMTGVAVGTVAALTYESIDPGEGSILLVPMGGFIGSFIGIVGGSLTGKVFSIEGSKEKMAEYFPELERRAFWTTEIEKK